MLAVILLYVTVEFDLTGFERKIPKIEDIASVNISSRAKNTYGNDTSIFINGRKYYYETPLKAEDFAFTKQEDIQNTIQLHKHLISQKNNDNSYHGYYLPIVYTLNNGKQIKRYYEISYERDKEFLAPVYKTDEIKKEKWYIFAAKDADILSVTVQDSRLKDVDNPLNDTFAIYAESDEKATALIEALKEDIKNVSFEVRGDYAYGLLKGEAGVSYRASF